MCLDDFLVKLHRLAVRFSKSDLQLQPYNQGCSKIYSLVNLSISNKIISAFRKIMENLLTGKAEICCIDIRPKGIYYKTQGIHTGPRLEYDIQNIMNKRFDSKTTLAFPSYQFYFLQYKDVQAFSNWGMHDSYMVLRIHTFMLKV